MNEVTKIHLGRQAFTIAAEAQQQLRSYLDDISAEVNDNDVTDEIELRMAELLAERGVTGDKVILAADIDYLKEQLGEPQDFKNDNQPAKPTGASHGKRLFRDPQNGWLGGVAAGLAAYFGVEPLLVRLLFVLFTFAWGGSIVVYILLWLLVPEARTSSERLQMSGTPVTVGSLMVAAARVDAGSAAGRVRDVTNRLFRLAVKAAGVGLTLFGVLLLAGLGAATLFGLVHGNIIPDNLFPVGFEEHLLVALSAFVAAMAAVFIILFGMALFARKWPIRGWLTGVLAGLTLIGFVAGGALAADTVPKVRGRYNADLHTAVRSLPTFHGVAVYGDAVTTVNYQYASKYAVSLQYFDKANISDVKTKVTDGVLTIDAQNYDASHQCGRICLPWLYSIELTLEAPTMPAIDYPYAGAKFMMPPDYRYAPKPPTAPILN